jgi:N-methylhydantoinase A/oxoprolinase/acetone carboxylase beta subunit
VYSVDIDVGGTLTDGLFSDDQRTVCTKVDSTPHDLTVCLFECLSQGASQLGFGDLTAFLEKVALLRWSTTITSNVLAERRGPKLGLLVSRGHEKDLYDSEHAGQLLNRLLDEKNVLGVDGVHDADILNAVRALLENGVRRICISLKGAACDGSQEERIKRIINEQYPDHYLGSVPVLTGSDISQNTDDTTRTYYAVINAYTHSALAATLFKAEDELRYTQGYSCPFLICHINGGVAGVSKTRAIDTVESGPILGLYGSAHMARMYGLKRVIAMDIGGTTAKIGVIHDGKPVHTDESDLIGIPVRVRLPYLRSIALGGGSVVSLEGNKVRLGPESVGSFPGPACYALGGDKATLTDAFVTAGLIDPQYFLGGTKPLDSNAAREAINSQVANPLGISLDKACEMIIGRAYDMVAGMIARASHDVGQDLSDHVLFAYGGNGGLFACGVAERAQIQTAYLFDLGPVFSAFGSSVSDISHIYERAFRLLLRDDADVTRLNQLLEEMRKQAVRDLLGEGVKPDNVEYSLELEFSGPGGATFSAMTTDPSFANIAMVRRLVRSDIRVDDVSVELIRMQVKKAISKPALVTKQKQGVDATLAHLGSRKVAHAGNQEEAQLYRWESLQPANIVSGTSILESANSTYFVPPGWTLEADQYGNGLVKRNGSQPPGA